MTICFLCCLQTRRFGCSHIACACLADYIKFLITSLCPYSFLFGVKSLLRQCPASNLVEVTSFATSCDQRFVYRYAGNSTTEHVRDLLEATRNDRAVPETYLALLPQLHPLEASKLTNTANAGDVVRIETVSAIAISSP